MKLKVGASFATAYEAGCIVVDDHADFTGHFAALDSDGVECNFYLPMVLDIESIVG